MLTLTQALDDPPQKATERMQGTSKYLQYQLEVLGVQGKWESEKKKKRQKFFKYIKIDTIGLYIHIHLTESEDKGNREVI